MTVNVNTVKNIYAGTNSVGPYPFTFPIFDSSDVMCISFDSNYDPSILVTNVDFTVSGLPATGSGTGSVTLTSTLPVGYTLVVMRAMDYLQGVNFTQGYISSESIDQALDKLAMQIQQIYEITQRSFAVPPYSSITSMAFTPAGGALIGWNDDATGLTNYYQLPAAVVSHDQSMYYDWRFGGLSVNSGRLTSATIGSLSPIILTSHPINPVVYTEYWADGLSWNPASISGLVPYKVVYGPDHTYHALYTLEGKLITEGILVDEADIANLKTELVDAQTHITSIQLSQSVGLIGYQTAALMNADLAHAADSLAMVTNDPTPVNNNTYIKLGASGTGSWQAEDTSLISTLISGVNALEATAATLPTTQVAYTPPQTASDAELDGSANWSERQAGFRALMPGSASFNSVLARVWCYDSSADIAWRLFIRPTGAVFDTSAVTPDDSGTIVAGSFPTSSQRYTLRLNGTLTASAGQYVFIMFIASTGAFINFTQWAYDAGISPARIGFPFSVTSAWGMLTLSIPSTYYGQAGIKLLLQTDGNFSAVDVPYSNTTSKLVAVDVQSAIDELKDDMAIPATTNITYTPPQVASDAELDGSMPYSNIAYMLGFKAAMTENISFSEIIARMWCIDATATIQWKLFIRPTGSVFDSSVVTPDDTGTIAPGSFPISSQRYTLKLNGTVTADIGQYVFLLFLAENGAKVSITYWPYNDAISPARLGFPLKLTTGWGTFLQSTPGTNPGLGYAQPGMKLVLQSSGNFSAINVPYSNTTSGLTATNVQGAIDEISTGGGGGGGGSGVGVPRIILPDEIVGVVGDTLQLFYRGFIEAQNPYNYPIDVSCAIGMNTSRYFQVTPVVGNVGSSGLTASILGLDGNPINPKGTTLVVVNPTGQPASNKKVICVGDSLTSGGIWPLEFYRRLCGSGGTPAGLSYGNITFIGDSGTAPQQWMGFGGWTIGTYLGTSRTGYWVVCSIDKDDTDQHSVWSDTSLNQWSLETIGTGEIKFMPITNPLSQTMPTGPSTLTWASGGSHHTPISYSSTTSEAATPFWDNATNAFSISAFCANNGFSGIDVMYLLLGWNGLSANAYDGSYYTALMTQMRTFMNQLHADYPSAKLRIMGIQVPSVNGGLGANYGATGAYADYYLLLRSVNGLNIAYQALCNEAAYSSWTKFLSIAPQFDSENNMQQTLTVVNSRNAATEEVGTNGVHPATAGYYQIADVAYRDFIRTYCSS